MKFFRRPLNLKWSISLVSIAFSLVLALLIVMFSFWWFRSVTRQNMVKTSEFNLQQTEAFVGRQLSAVQTLIRWCNMNRHISDFFTTDTFDRQKSLDVYDRFVEELRNCPAALYINRFVVAGLNGKMVQAGSGTTQSRPLNRETLAHLVDLQNPATLSFDTIVSDPLSYDDNDLVIPIVQPVYNLYSGELIAYAYIAVSVQLFTDQIKNYQLPADSLILLELSGSDGRHTYRINSNSLEEIPLSFSADNPDSIETNRSSTFVGRVRYQGMNHIFVKYRFENNKANLVQILSAQQDSSQTRFFVRLIIWVFAALIVFALLLRFILSYLVTKPVDQLTKRLSLISEGDFSEDKSILWDNELGEIGQGINNLSQNIQTLMDKAVENEKQKREYEFKILQNQINPHFMYNTLNSIRWMATIQKAPGIAEMVTSFASLLRNIANNTDETILLSDELSLLDDYFIVQKYRYGGSITMEVNVEEPELLQARIPRFTLQPLLENAIYHGIEPKGNAGCINVDVHQPTDCKNCVIIDITDDGLGMTPEQAATVLMNTPSGKGNLFRHVGVSNVHQRLKLVFGQEYGLSVESEQGVFTRVSVRIPFDRENCS